MLVGDKVNIYILRVQIIACTSPQQRRKDWMALPIITIGSFSALDGFKLGLIVSVGHLV